MSTLPQLLEEDIQAFDVVLGELLRRSDAATALLVDKGGFLITHRGETDAFDITTLSALAAGAYAANQTIAHLLQEPQFTCVYQQGENLSLLVINVDDSSLLTIIFRSQVGVGAVKFYASKFRERIARQLRIAQERDPKAGIDLSSLNLADTRPVFRRQT